MPAEVYRWSGDGLAAGLATGLALPLRRERRDRRTNVELSLERRPTTHGARGPRVPDGGYVGRRRDPPSREHLLAAAEHGSQTFELGARQLADSPDVRVKDEDGGGASKPGDDVADVQVHRAVEAAWADPASLRLHPHQEPVAQRLGEQGDRGQVRECTGAEHHA